MMALVKIAILLFVVFTAAALENSRETDSIHELHPYLSSPAPSPSKDLIKTSNFCAIKCASKCATKKSFLKPLCIAICLARCKTELSDLSEIACAIECAQSSTDNFRYAITEDRMNACSQKCEKN